MAVAVAIIQKLDGEAVFGPVHAGRGLDHPDGQQAFIADGKLDQDMRQFAVGQGKGSKRRGFPEYPHPGQHSQLHRQGRDRHKDAGQRELQRQGERVATEEKTVHGESTIPQRLESRRNGGIIALTNVPGEKAKPSRRVLRPARTRTPELLTPGWLYQGGTDRESPVPGRV